MSFTSQILNGRVIFILPNSEVVDITTLADFEKVLNSSPDSLDNIVELAESSYREELENQIELLKSGGSINPGSNLIAYSTLIQNCSRFLAEKTAKQQEERDRIELLNEINSPEFQ